MGSIWIIIWTSSKNSLSMRDVFFFLNFSSYSGKSGVQLPKRAVRKNLATVTDRSMVPIADLICFCRYLLNWLNGFNSSILPLYLLRRNGPFIVKIWHFECLFINYTYFSFIELDFSHLFLKELVSLKVVEEIAPEISIDEKLWSPSWPLLPKVKKKQLWHSS